MWTNKIENPNSYNCNHLVFNKGVKSTYWKKTAILTNDAWKLNIQMYKNEIISISLSYAKKKKVNLKQTKDLKTQNTETASKKHRNRQGM